MSKYGVDCSGCTTKHIIERAKDNNLKVPKKKSTRGSCNCLLENEIGNTCGHGCIYCYAKYNEKTVRDNMKKHNPNSLFLIDENMDGDIIKETRQKSYIDVKKTLF